MDIRAATGPARIFWFCLDQTQRHRYALALVQTPALDTLAEDPTQ